MVIVLSLSRFQFKSNSNALEIKLYMEPTVYYTTDVYANSYFYKRN